jgi:uncharacterized protein YndB with AHSA1/START domain
VSDVPPVRKQIVVAASQAHAFRVFTNGIERWWPREHHIGKAPMKSAVLEPRVGGRWYEIGEDGSECNWGKVLAWEPPARLLLAWQITASWQYDPDFVTEVEVTFSAEGPKKTRVVLEHRNLDRFGEAAPAMRNALDSPGGWTGTLDLFGRVASEAAP